MFQPRRRIRIKRLHKVIVAVQLHFIRIGEGIEVTDISRRIITDVHRRADLKHRFLFLLRSIDSRRQLRVAETVKDAMVTDPVTGSEILVRRIIKHAPGDTSDMCMILHGRVKYAGMP